MKCPIDGFPVAVLDASTEMCVGPKHHRWQRRRVEQVDGCAARRDREALPTLQDGKSAAANDVTLHQSW